MDLLQIKPHKITEGLLGKHVLVYGSPSTRKTTFGTNFSKPLLLATEIGYSFIPNVKAVNIESWYQFKEVLEQLKRSDVRAEYNTIVIDTVSLLAEQCQKYILNKHGVDNLSKVPYGGGWKDYKVELSSTFNLIAQLGYGIVFISHSKEEYNDEGALVGARPILDTSTSTIVNALTDFIFFLQKEQTEEGTNVWAYSNLGDSFVTKSRVRNLNPRIDFTFDNVEKAVVEATAKSGIEIGTLNEVKEINSIPKLSLDDLKASITEKANQLLELGLEEAIATIIQRSLHGVNVPNATMVHYDALEAINQSLKDELLKANG